MRGEKMLRGRERLRWVNGITRREVFVCNPESGQCFLSTYIKISSTDVHLTTLRETENGRPTQIIDHEIRTNESAFMPVDKIPDDLISVLIPFLINGSGIIHSRIHPELERELDIICAEARELLGH